MKLHYLLIFLMIILSTGLSAGNSIFSADGMACKNYGNDIYGMSMGDTGISDIFRRNFGYGNPAILGSITATQFSTGILCGWTNYKSKDEEEKSYRDNSLDFPYFSVAVPLKNHHFGFQFNSYSSGSVQSKKRFTAYTETGDTLSALELQSIDGYIYRADLIYAIHYQHMNWGAALNYYFGHDIRRVAQDIDFEPFNAVYKDAYTFKNPSATFGFTGDWNNIALGLYYSLGRTLEGSRTLSSIFETENAGDAKFDVPDELGTGLTAKFADEYKISGDYVYSFWDKTNNTRMNHNSWKMGIGFAHEPKEHSHKTFVGQMNKRCGVTFRELPFLANGNTVRETAVTGGFAIPLKRVETRLDFGVQYSWRGNLDDNNLQDRALMFMIGMTGFDILTKAYDRSAPREIPKAEEITE